MDVPVEATIHLDPFPDKLEVKNLLRLHGFNITELDGGRVFVRGHYQNLRAVKAQLERIIDTTPTSSSRIPVASRGAIPKHSSGSFNRHPVSQDYRTSSLLDHRLPETIFVDADIFSYVKRLRKKDLENILTTHHVEMKVNESGDSTSITLQGRSARTAVSKVERLLDDLNKSLRTQEVLKTDLGQEGRVLLRKIKNNKHISGLVLVCETKDRLHLIGPSAESYELKQSLLGKPGDQPARRGSTFLKIFRGRSRSLPPTSRKSSARNDGVGNGVGSPAGGAAGFSKQMKDNIRSFFSRKSKKKPHKNTF